MDIRHGTRSGYDSKCRCDECSAFHRERMRKYRSSPEAREKARAYRRSEKAKTYDREYWKRPETQAKRKAYLDQIGEKTREYKERYAKSEKGIRRRRERESSEEFLSRRNENRKLSSHVIERELSYRAENQDRLNEYAKEYYHGRYGNYWERLLSDEAAVVGRFSEEEDRAILELTAQGLTNCQIAAALRRKPVSIVNRKATMRKQGALK